MNCSFYFCRFYRMSMRKACVHAQLLDKMLWVVGQCHTLDGSLGHSPTLCYATLFCRTLYEDVRYDRSLTYALKLSIQLNLAHVARN